MKISLEEYQNKLSKIRDIIIEKKIKGILITKQTNFSWLTGGRALVSLASEASTGQILVTADQVYLIANNIECGRLMKEEVVGLEMIDKPYYWYDEPERVKIINEIMGDGKLEDDNTLAAEFYNLRKVMTDLELDKYRILGKEATQILEDTCREVSIRQTEFEVAGILAAKLWKLGIEPTNILLGFDERAFQFRHPIPSSNKLEKYGMLILSVRRHGLIINCSRLIHFGAPSDELMKRLHAVARVDAAFILNTRPGAVAGEIFRKAVQVYEETGYGEEWKLHHQGGLTGYVGREYRGTMSSTNVVELNQVFSWNPSIAGTKSEDTFVILENGNENITRSGAYPEIEVEYNGEKILRPGILIR